MNEVNLIKSNRSPFLKVILLTILALYFGACANNSIVPVAEYSTKIIGSWQGTVGNLKETMSINGDSTFICKIHPNGFIANTLSQSANGTISGTWKITGSILMLRMTGTKNENLENKSTSSMIESFKVDELVLKSNNGETSHFQRVHIHWYNSKR